MRNMLKVTLGLLAAAVFAIPASASADDHQLTLKLEPGVAVPLTQPQSDRFGVGGALQVTPLIGLTPWLDVGPTGSVLVLPSRISGIDAGTAWGLGAAARLKRPHDESNTGTGFSAVSPWADGQVQYVRTDPLDRAALSLAVGASVPTSDARTLWVGPFVRYQDVVESLNSKTGFDTSDAHVLILGVSLEFAGAKKVVKQEPLSDRDHDGTPDVTDRCPDVPGPKENQGCPWPEVKVDPKPEPKPLPPVVQSPIELRQIVQFAWDSSVLRSSENPQLAEVTALLLKNLNYNVRIEGHASSEGQVEHNNKLSEKRAQSVLDFLVKQGVAKDRLSAVGLGSTVPVADNATEAGRVANRRVEFVVKFVLVNGESK